MNSKQGGELTFNDEFRCCNIFIIGKHSIKDETCETVVYEKTLEIQNKLDFSIYPDSLKSFAPSLSTSVLKIENRLQVVLKRKDGGNWVVLVDQLIDLIPEPSLKVNPIPERLKNNTLKSSKTKDRKESFQNISLPFSSFTYEF